MNEECIEFNELKLLNCEENEENINAMINDEYEYIIDKIDEFLSKLENNIFHLEGSMGLWNGNFPVNQPTKIYYFKDDFMSKIITDTMYLTIKFYPKSGKIEIEKIHHDGTNYYTLSPIEKWRKEEIKEYVLELYKNNEDELKEIVRDYYELPFSKLRKFELLEIIEEY